MSSLRFHRPLFVATSGLVSALLILGSPFTSLADQQDDLDEINDEMIKIRQLEQIDPVEVTFKDRPTLQDETTDDLTSDYPESEQDVDQRVLVAFGFLEPGEDIGDIYVVLFGGQVAGYYDPATKEMVLVSDSTNDGELTASDKATYSHEFVHALQDQNYELGAYINLRIDSADDQSMAVTSLIEGDATSAQIEYLTNHLDVVQDLQDELDQSGDGTEDLDGIAPIFTETLYFPYNQGYDFIEDLRQEGGWELVDAAYANPPTSSEQILHPEKYLDGEQPKELPVVDVRSALGEDWESLDLNTFGEFQISIMLDEGDVSSREARLAAEGWGGDSYIVAGDDSTEVIYWNTTWDTADDADEFREALVTREQQRLDAEVETSDSVTTITSDDLDVQITTSGKDVTYVYAPDQEMVNSLVDAEPADGPGLLSLDDEGTPDPKAISSPVACLPAGHR